MNISPNKTSFPVVFTAVVALTLSSPPVDAANITWGTPQGISGIGDVSTTGTLVGAANIGDTGVPSTMLNGVTFQSLAAPGGNGTSGNFAITTASDGSADNSGGASGNAPFTALA